ncbi:MAG TPA: hypothetical protein VFM51_07490 [Solirubrobacterales bacterium]|nr:hypothetical protein [Solirubrobacterales bacterium]
MLWDDLDMELERKRCDFERRLEEGRGDLVERIEKLQRSLREGGEARRREWEELEGRLMTAEEKRQFENDHIQMVLAQMTDAFVGTVRAANEDMRRENAESRAESRAKFEELLAEARAQRQATLRMLDRLPPSKEEGG